MSNLNTNNEYNIKDLLPSPSSSPPESNMKNELKNFLKKQLNSNDDTSTSITALDTMMSTSYSEFKN